jgi:hypothetical protein
MLEVPCEGGCQCGAVRYRCTAQPFVSYTCHCLECQHMTSSAFATLIQVPAEAFTLEKGAAAVRDRVAASKVATDITEDRIRSLAIPLGFVDIKVCAVSATWSGLKLVVRKSLRDS